MIVQIIPAILEKDKQEIVRKIRLVKDLVEQVQIDIIDGKFTDNKTVKIEELAGLNEEVNVSVHLIIEKPIELVEQCQQIGADSVVAQIELMDDQIQFVKTVKEKNIKVGLALDLKTPVDSINDQVIKDLDSILLMAVTAGFPEQRFDNRVLAKIKVLRKKYGFNGDIWIDGGVNQETIKICVQAGANLLAVGSALWTANNLKVTLEELRQLAVAAV